MPSDCLDAPTVAPVYHAPPSGAPVLGPATYTVQYAWTNRHGHSALSPTGDLVDIAGVAMAAAAPTLPPGATGTAWWIVAIIPFTDLYSSRP